MEAKDLMVGTYAYFNCFGDKKIIVKLTGFENNIVYGISEIGSHWCNIEKVEPILLTSEILEKNGFIANKRVYPYPYYEYINEGNKLKIGFAFPQGNSTSYKEPWVYIDSEYVFVEHLPCIYVQQLQLTLRLCGIEKEILSVILFTSCSEPEDVNKYKGCVVMKKIPAPLNGGSDILYIKLTPELKSSRLNGLNVRGDFYKLCLYKLDSKNLNVGDTIK